MRADRSYIAGLGTTSVLVAAAVLLFAVVSTLVAFRGWPGVGLAEDIGHLVIGEPKRALPVEGPKKTARDAAPAAAAVAGAPARGSAAAAAPRADGTVQELSRAAAPPTVPGPGGGGGRGGGFRNDPRLVVTPPTPRVPVSTPRRSPVALLPETSVSEEVQRVTNGLGDTTQSLTDGLGQPVGQLSPQLGDLLTDTGRALAALLRGLGQPSP